MPDRAQRKGHWLLCAGLFGWQCLSLVYGSQANEPSKSPSRHDDGLECHPVGTSGRLPPHLFHGCRATFPEEQLQGFHPEVRWKTGCQVSLVPVLHQVAEQIFGLALSRIVGSECRHQVHGCQSNQHSNNNFPSYVAEIPSYMHSLNLQHGQAAD